MIRKRCMAGDLPGAVKRGGCWQIPATADVRLCTGRVAGQKIDGDEFRSIPVDKRDEALRKLGVVQAFEQYSGGVVRNGGLRSEAMIVFCEREQISPASLKRWSKAFRERGLAGLVDNRGGGENETISPEAWLYFKSLYLDQRRPTIRHCLKLLTFLNKSERRGWVLPSYKSLCRYIDRHLSRPVLVLHREGDAAYDAKCGPYIQIDPESIEPGSIFVGDHHQLNVLIRHRGQWIRPWLTAWLDMRSRTLVGWNLCPLPNSTTISQAFKRAVETYGPPDTVKIDNGKDYASQMFCGVTKKQRRILKKGYLDEAFLRGVYGMMGVGVSFSIPYHPQSKNIERWFDTFDSQLCKNFTTYCGKDAARKPEGLFDYLNTQAAIHEAYTLETLEPLIEKYIDAYNRTPHASLGGKTPLDVMDSRESKRVCAPGVLDLLLRVWTPELTVGKNGVRFAASCMVSTTLNSLNIRGSVFDARLTPTTCGGSRFTTQRRCNSSVSRNKPNWRGMERRSLTNTCASPCSKKPVPEKPLKTLAGRNGSTGRNCPIWRCRLCWMLQSPNRSDARRRVCVLRKQCWTGKSWSIKTLSIV